MRKIGIWAAFIGVALPLVFLPLTSLLPPTFPEDTRGFFDRIGALGVRVSEGKGWIDQCWQQMNRQTGSFLNANDFDQMERDQNPGGKTNYEMCVVSWKADPRTEIGQVVWFTTVLFVGTLIATLGVGLLIAAKLQSP